MSLTSRTEIETSQIWSSEFERKSNIDPKLFREKKYFQRINVVYCQCKIEMNTLCSKTKFLKLLRSYNTYLLTSFVSIIYVHLDNLQLHCNTHFVSYNKHILT